MFGALDNPPFTPRMCTPSLLNKIINTQLTIDVVGGNLTSKALCPSARQYLSNQYNLHSMYGYFEAQSTNM